MQNWLTGQLFIWSFNMKKSWEKNAYIWVLIMGEPATEKKSVLCDISNYSDDIQVSWFCKNFIVEAAKTEDKKLPIYLHYYMQNNHTGSASIYMIRFGLDIISLYLHRICIYICCQIYKQICSSSSRKKCQWIKVFLLLKRL